MRTRTLEQNSAQDFAGLQVDLLQKLRNGSMTFKQILWFKDLSFEQREELMSNVPKIKLIDFNIVIDGNIGGFFSPSLHFNLNRDIKYVISSNFENHILNQVDEIGDMPKMNFSKYQFINKIISDKEIMDLFQISNSHKLMTKKEILWVIMKLTSIQSKGQPGILKIDGLSTVVGYILCGDDIIRAVSVRWEFVECEWYCNCVDLGDWPADFELLLCN